MVKFAGYSREEINEMDDKSVFRRFFVATNILRELVGMITGRDPGGIEGGGEASPINPFMKPGEVPIKENQTIGGQSPIRGTRPRASRPSTPQRRRGGAPQLPNTARYNFPKPDESV